MGRPTKLTDDLQDDLCDLLSRGVPQEPAAYALGIDPATFFRWKVRGDSTRDDYDPKKDERYCEFRKAVDKARGEAESTYSLMVRKAAAAGDVKAAMWWLDRAHPERWAQRQTIQHENDGEPIIVEVTGWPTPGEEEGTA